MGPEVAAAATLGSLAFDVGGKIVGGQGQAASQEFMAERDKRSAELSRLKADQTDVFYRERLNDTIANIESIRAAANIDPTSPTSAAIIANEARISDRERQIKTASLRAQASEDDASALFRRRVGEDALLGSYLGAGATVAGGLGRAYARGGPLEIKR